MQNLMNAPFTLVRDDHYVVTDMSGKSETLAFGQYLPLSKRAASQFVKATGRVTDFRVIKRTTARRLGLV